jgi:predicted acetyltransferase
VIETEPNRARFRDASPSIGRTRIVDVEEAARLFPPIYERIRPREPGFLARSPEWWRGRYLEDAPRRRDRGRLFRVVLEIDGRPEGYAVYRLRPPFDDHGLPAGQLDVLDAQATTPVATRELWQYLFGVDLVARVRAYRLGPDHPLLLTLADPRRLRANLRDGLWLRLLDVPAALAARRYAADGALVLELVDAFMPDNAGRWHLDAGADGARVERTTDAPDLTLDAEALGMAFLGGTSFGALVRASRVMEQAAGAAARADVLFRTPTAPWCADDF